MMSVQFLNKMARPLCLTLPIHLILVQQLFFGFPGCGSSETKMSETLKGIEIYEFKNCFEQWEKHLNRCIAKNGEYLEGL